MEISGIRETKSELGVLILRHKSTGNVKNSPKALLCCSLRPK